MPFAETMTAAQPASRERWPLAVAFAAVFAVIGLFLWQSIRLNAGHFVYAQDDPYIHLVIARTLATHGVWGVSPEAFAAASSSPLWTAALAVLWPLGGASGLWPLVLNLVGAAWLTFSLDRQLQCWVCDERSRATALVATALILPLPTLVLIGMEHTVHVAAVVTFCGAAARRLEANPPGVVWLPGLALAMLVSGLRYEGLFVSAVVAALFAWRGRRAAALLILIAAAAPAVAYGAYAAAHGGLPLPNSVIMKSGASRFGSVGALFGIANDWLSLLFLYRRPVLAVLILASLAAVAWRAAIGGAATSSPPSASGRASVRESKRGSCTQPAVAEPWDAPLVIAAMFLGTAVLHVCLVKLDWFFRYEAYVVALGCLAVAANLAHAPSSLMRRSGDWLNRLHRAALISSVVVLSLPLLTRAAEAAVVSPRASHEVYLQQYQLGLFFREHYAGATVALNDIGAVSWLAPVRVVDIAGLASSEVATARRRSRVDTAYLAELVRRENVRVIAVYEWYLLSHGDLPSSWRRVGAWDSIPHVAVSGDRVVFYAPDDERAEGLRAALRAFESRLPSGARLVLFR